MKKSVKTEGRKEQTQRDKIEMRLEKNVIKNDRK